MTDMSVLFERNKSFSDAFDKAGLPVLPKLNTLLLTCIDARVDPAHVLGLELGDAVVVRNNGGRVTRSVIEEIAVLATMVSKMTQAPEPAFNVVLMQHTQCGAQNFANPEFQATLKEKLGIDVSSSAITDQEADLKTDIGRLRDAPEIPGSITVSAVLYDVRTGRIHEIAEARRLDELRRVSKAEAV